jgi:hypothetical protein
MKLNLSDYKKILDFYNINHTRLSSNSIKKKAENMLANKLCRCIKKVNLKQKRQSKQKINRKIRQQGESQAIGACRNSVITRKNLKIHKFKCDNGPKLVAKANSKVKLARIGSLKRLSVKNNKTRKIRKK